MTTLRISYALTIAAHLSRTVAFIVTDWRYLLFGSSTRLVFGRKTETYSFSALVTAQGETPLILNTPMKASNLRRVVGYDFHHICKKYACRIISAHVGDYCSSTWKPRGLISMAASSASSTLSFLARTLLAQAVSAQNSSTPQTWVVRERVRNAALWVGPGFFSYGFFPVY